MPVRLILACFVVLTVLGIALLLLEEPVNGVGRGVSGASILASRPETTFPDAGELQAQSADTNPSPLLPEHVPETREEGLAARAGILADGWVSGHVVDPTGSPQAGVPVLLYVVEDPWDEKLDDDELSLKIGSMRTDEAGAFKLPARSGAAHTLFAGGLSWARVRLDEVVASDQLQVRVEDPRWIEGVVRDAEWAEPIAGAQVLVIGGAESLTAHADETGAFRLAPVPFENVQLAAWAPGFEIGFVEDALPGWEPVTMELEPGREVTGTVIHAETREPLAGVEVRFSMDLAARVANEGSPELEAAQDTVFEQVVLTDEAGEFFVPDVPSTGFVLDLTAEGFVPHRHTGCVDWVLPLHCPISLRMSPLEEVQGRVVVGPDQAGVPGVPVELSADDEVLVRGTADETGAFSFALDEWSGQGRLVVTAFGDEDLRGSTRVRRHSDEQELLVHLTEPVSLRVKVTAGSSPIAGAQVAVEAGRGPDEPMLVSTGSDGTVELSYSRSSPDVEHVSLQARYAGTQSLPIEVGLVEAEGLSEIVLDLEEGTWIEGVVRDVAGHPIAGARVWGRGVVGAHTDFEGTFRLGPLEEGTGVKLTAFAPGYRETRTVIDAVSPWMDALNITLESVVLWTGRVIDGATGFPVEKYHARLQRERLMDTGPVFKNLKMRVDHPPGDPGALSAELPSEGRYRLLISSLDYAEAVSEIVVFDGTREPPPTEIFLMPAAVLEVTVRDSSGRPVPGFRVNVVDALASKDPKRQKKARKNSPSRRTNSEGVARFNLGAGGVYRLASGGAGWLGPQQLNVTPGPVIEETYHLPATGDLALVVLDDSGSPMNRPRVTVRTAGKNRAYDLMRKSSPRGAPEQVLFEALPPGEYALSVRARGHESIKATTVVMPRRTQHKQLVLRKSTPPPRPTGAHAGHSTGTVRHKKH